MVRFGTDGVTGFAGALALGCLMLPIIIRSTEEMLRLVPDHLREASYALGAEQGPHDRHGGPAAGVARHPQWCAPGRRPRRRRDRTAAVHHRCGDAPSTGTSFSGPNTALSAQIFANAQQPYAGAQERAWGAALTLIVMAFVLMVLSRAVAAFFARRGTR